MGAAFRHGALCQDIDALGRGHIGKPVGDEQDSFGAGELMDLLHDVVFALHVNVGCGLVKEIDRAVVEQGTGQCQTLALTAGQVAALLGQLGVQTGLAAQKVCQTGALHHRPW